MIKYLGYFWLTNQYWDEDEGGYYNVIIYNESGLLINQNVFNKEGINLKNFDLFYHFSVLKLRKKVLFVNKLLKEHINRANIIFPIKHHSDPCFFKALQ